MSARAQQTRHDQALPCTGWPCLACRVCCLPQSLVDVASVRGSAIPSDSRDRLPSKLKFARLLSCAPSKTKLRPWPAAAAVMPGDAMRRGCIC